MLGGWTWGLHRQPWGRVALHSCLQGQRKAHAFLLQQQPYLRGGSPEPGPGPASQPDTEDSCCECQPEGGGPSTDPPVPVHTAPSPPHLTLVPAGTWGRGHPASSCNLLIHSPISGLAHKLLRTPPRPTGLPLTSPWPCWNPGATQVFRLQWGGCG